jgi:hypothetical protein
MVTKLTLQTTALLTCLLGYSQGYSQARPQAISPKPEGQTVELVRYHTGA